MTVCEIESAIGMFDSGIGGLTVMQRVMERLPNEQLIYFGDTARFPYGDKSPEVVRCYTRENAKFLIQQGIKALVIACNTSSAFSFKRLQEEMSIPLVDVIGPGAALAATKTRTGHIAVIGTEGTISSGAYQHALAAICPGKIRVTAIACPLFAPLVEEGFSDHAATHLIAEEYLGFLRSTDVDTLLLGCTHYPMLYSAIKKVIADHVALVDSATACAEALAQTLHCHAISRTTAAIHPHRYFVSYNPSKFCTHASAFLSIPPQEVSLVAS